MDNKKEDRRRALSTHAVFPPFKHSLSQLCLLSAYSVPITALGSGDGRVNHAAFALKYSMGTTDPYVIGLL